MEQAPFLPAPRRRWWRSRTVVYLGALIVLFVGAYWFHDWFFMSEDLRHIQGDWEIVKVTDGPGKKEKKADRKEIVTFKGRTAILPGMPNDLVPIDISNGKFYLCDPDNTHTILGFQIRLPLWLSRAKGQLFGTYEFKDDQLVLAFIGEVDESKNRKELLEDAQEVLYLERPRLLQQERK